MLKINPTGDTSYENQLAIILGFLPISTTEQWPWPKGRFIYIYVCVCVMRLAAVLLWLRLDCCATLLRTAKATNKDDSLACVIRTRIKSNITQNPNPAG